MGYECNTWNSCNIDNLVIEDNHTIEEYMDKYGEKYDDGDLVSYTPSEFCRICKPRTDIKYWLINGNYYETNISTNELEESRKKKKKKETPIPMGEFTSLLQIVDKDTQCKDNSQETSSDIQGTGE